MFEITTQGTQRLGYLDQKLITARKNLDGEIKNDRSQYFLYEQDSKEELIQAYEENDDDLLFKSNPNLGTTVTLESLKYKIKEMIDDPSLRTTTLTKNFNIPQNKENSYYSADECKAVEFDEEFMYNKPTFIGLDMAYTRNPTNDLTALTFCVVNPNNDNRYHLDYFFLPKSYYNEQQEEADMIKEKTVNDRVDYDYFAKRKEIIIVDDVEIRENYIISFITDVINKYNMHVIKFGVDPNKAENIIKHFNSKANDDKFCINFLAERKMWTFPIIEKSKYLRSKKQVFTNNKMTEINFANANAKYDSNNYIVLVNENAKRKDMGIAAFKVQQTSLNEFVISIKKSDDYKVEAEDFIRQQIREGFDKDARKGPRTPAPALQSGPYGRFRTSAGTDRRWCRCLPT